MIDFRYHIVSLIAVFLALAVGVVLGAGPLQGSIGDQLAVQVENLRAEKEDLRIQLEESQARVDELGTFVDATSPQLLQELLTDVDVTVIETAAADAATTEALLERISQAGGNVVGHVGLSPRWTDPTDAAVRDETAKSLAEQMAAPPADGTATSQVLGMALAQALTASDPETGEQLTDVATGFYDALREADLISEVQAPSAPADVVLMVAPVTAADAEPDASFLGIQTATVVGLAGTGTVVAGTDTGPADLLAAIRADDNASAAVSSVDSVDEVSGQVTAILALAASARGAGHGHYGMSADADAVLPTVPELPEEEPTDEPTDATTDDPSGDPSGEGTEEETE